MHFSTFTKYMNENRRNVPAKLWNNVRREGIARLTERLQAGRADCELCFRDLILKIEAAII